MKVSCDTPCAMRVALMIPKPLPHLALDHVIGHRAGPLVRESMRGHQLRLKLRVSADRLAQGVRVEGLLQEFDKSLGQEFLLPAT